MTFSTNISSVVTLLAVWCGSAVSGVAQPYNTYRNTVTDATGTITQLNYDNNGNVQGFLVGTNILLLFPTNICGGIGALGVAGNSVTYSGSVFMEKSGGFESVEVTSFTNNSTKATYTVPGYNFTSYGPASGTVKQLNYDAGGSLDGFLFTASGSSSPIFVFTGSYASNMLTTVLTVGATVSVSGNTSAKLSGCSSTGSLETVYASSLTVGGETINVGYGDRWGMGWHW